MDYNKHTGIPNRRPYLRKLIRKGVNLNWLIDLSEGKKMPSTGLKLEKADITELKRRGLIKKTKRETRTGCTIWEAGNQLNKYLAALEEMGMKIELEKWRGRPYYTIKTKLPNSIFEVIDKVTSYKIKGYEYIDNRIYKCPVCDFWILKQNAISRKCKRCGELCEDGLWDGVIRLLSKTKAGEYYFPAGLLETIETTLKPIGVDIEIKKPVECHKTSDQKLGLAWIGPKTRSHQDEAYTKAMERLKNERNVILEMPTGSGKTLTAIKIIRDLDVPTLILVHKKVLMNQWVKAFKTNTGYEPKQYGDKSKEIGPITIGMVQSISKNSNFDIGFFDCVVVDECHHTPCNETYKVMMKSDARYKFGLSATARREDGNELKMIAAIGSIVKVATTRELIERGILAKPTIEYIIAPIARRGSTYAESYKNQITLNDERSELIARRAYKFAEEGKSVLIAVDRIVHGARLNKMIKGSKFIHGKTNSEERNEVLDAFEKKELLILISTLLNEGSDIPSLDALIIAGGGKSEIAQIQKIGRALRVTNKKDSATIVDVQDPGKWLRDHAQQRAATYAKMFG